MTGSPSILVNGVAGGQVDGHDRGLQYGDGLFETLAVKDGVIHNWPSHWQRLEQGCHRLAIPAPERHLVESELAQMSADGRHVLKLMVTRGVGGRGYQLPEAIRPTRIITRHPWPNYPTHRWTEGVTLHVCQTRLSCNPVLAGIKHLNRLEQIMARREWSDEGIAEGIMLNQSGEVVEGVMSNLFAVINGTLVTPDLHRCGVVGTMRSRVMELASTLGWQVHEKAIGLDQLAEADELFVCNSVIGVWPVRQLDKRSFSTHDLAHEILAVLAHEFPFVLDESG